MTVTAAFAAGYILGGVSGLFLFAWLFGSRREGAAEEHAKNSERISEAVVKGQEASQKGAAEAVSKLKAGKSPQAIKEANDAKWR